MPASTGVWGIDIGQCALKALRLELVDGQPTATAFDYVEHPKILSQPDADPDQLIREALEKFLARNAVRYDQVAVGIAGQSGLARFVKLPPVEEKRIADIVKFEAKQQIPFPLEEVVWDFQKVAGGEVLDGFAMETEVGLFAMKRDVIARYLAYFVGVKTEVHIVQMSPLALVNYATYEILQGKEAGADDDTPAGKRRCVVVLDIGTEASNLIITDGGKIIWQRPVPLGGNNFTRALTKEMKLTFAKAEHLKRNAAKSPDLAQILKAIKPVLTDFVGEVQRSLGYFANTHRDAHVAEMVGLGSAFRLPGLHKYLSEKLQLEVKRPAKFDRLAGDKVTSDPLFAENTLTFPVAYGLALQGLGAARIQTNLLPGEIKLDRLIRAKKPAAVAAAAALLLGTGAMSLGYSTNYAALAAKPVEDAMKTAGVAVKSADDRASALAAKNNEVEDYKRQVKASIAGQDERLNWVRLDEVLSSALPLPGDNGTLTAKFDDGSNQDKFWRSNPGNAAMDKFRERLQRGLRIEDINVDDLTQDLAMVNVEAVTCRWVENLPEFFEKADKQAQTDYTRSIADSMKPDEVVPDDTGGGKRPKAPDGGGWVFEIRGFTHHKDRTAFVTGSLLKNIQRLDDFCKDDVKGDKTENKVTGYLPGVPDPVKGKVSHAFLYFALSEENPQGGFRHINKSYLPFLLAPGTGPGEGPVPAPSPVAGDPGKKPYTSLLSGSESAGGPGRDGPGAVIPPPATGPATGPTALKPKPRTEFVIMFVWKEPVTSDIVGDAPSAPATPAPSAKPGV